MITKNCQACGKGFGFFHKKCICQVCSEGFCEKCLTTGHDYQNRGILTTHRLCAKCVTSLKAAPSTPTNSTGGTEMKFNPNAPTTSTATKDPSQLDKQLEHMMEEQQLPLNVRERTRLLDVGTKWQLIRAYEQSLTLEKNEKNQPGYWVEKLQNPSSQIWKDPLKMQRFVNTIKSQSKTWCVQLLRDKGLSALLEGFHQTKSDEVKVFALKAINAIISTRAGLEAFLGLPAAIQPLVLFSLSAPNDCRFEIYEFLATAIGFSPDQGLPVVLEAITSTQCGRIPFKPFVDMLTAPQTSHGVRFKLLVLINAIVNSADMLEDRQRTRQLLRSADFVKALTWLRTEVNTHRATVDGAALGINRQNTPASPQLGSPQVVTATNIPLDQARTHRATTVTAIGATAGNKIVDQSEIWEMIRVQIELFEHSEEDDSLDATRGGVDFGSIDQLLEYVRVHMSPHVGQYLLPLLQMICILPLDSQKGQTLWSAVLTVVKRVIGASQANENLSLDELFSLTEQYAQQATMSASDAIVNEKNQLEKQVNSLREKIRELESRPQPQQQVAPVAVVTPPPTTDAPAPATSNKELQQAKAEMLGLRTQLSQVTKELEALKAAGPAATTTAAVASTTTGGSPEQAEALQKALAQITALQQEIERLKASGGGAAGPAGPAVATQDTTITINTPQPPCLPGFTPVPHQPRTIVIPAGQPLPGQPAGTAPAATTGGTATPAAPTSAIPQAPVLPGFKGAAGAPPAAGASSAAPSGGNCQPDGKPWPPVLPGFKAQPGNPNGAGSSSSSTTTSSSSPAATAAPPQPVEPPVKLPYTRKPIKPKQKMRQLHWTKLEDKVIESTIWFNLNDQKNVSLNLSELDSLFCQAAPKQPQADGAETAPGGAPKAPAKAQQITFVEGQRGQNMSIAVSRFRPLTFEQIRDAILQVDTKTLSLDTAVAMSKWLPTPEEVEAVSSYDGPIADLAPTDKFIMIVGKVPALDRRLDAFIFKQQYQTTYDELNTKLNSCYTVLKNLKESKSLLRTLEYILAMGNYLNGGTTKGEAFGFQIAYINQLGNTRSCDNKTNLLQYFVPIFDKDPQTANLSECFVGIDEVARIDLNQLTSDVSKFNAAINKINGLIKQLSAKPQPGDKFVDVMTPFVTECEPKGKSLQASLQNVVAIAKDMAVSYGEDASKFGPTQIFQLYSDFSKQLTATRNELKRQQELKEKQEKMAIAAAQRAAAGGNKPAGLPPGVGGPMAGGKPGTGLEGADGMNALQLALAQRKDRPPVVPNRKPPTAEDEVATQVQGTLTGSDAGSVLAAIKARREERSQQQGSMGGQNKRRSVFGTQPEQKP